MGDIIKFMKRIPQQTREAIVGRGYAKWRRRLHYLYLEELAEKEKRKAESAESVTERDIQKSVDISPRERTDEEELEEFLVQMASIEEPIEVQLPDAVDFLGESVFTLIWGRGGYSNGVDSVYSLGPYYFCDVSEGTFGPFRTLLDALKFSEMTVVTSATESIECTEIEADELVKILSFYDLEIGFQLIINGEVWKLNSERFNAILGFSFGSWSRLR